MDGDAIDRIERVAARSGKRLTARQRVLSLVYYAERFPLEVLSVPALAARCGLSEFYFQRVFRAVMGETAKQFVLRIRLQRAALTLKTSDLPIAMAAAMAGFATHAGFTKAFGRVYGVSPRIFRNGVTAADWAAVTDFKDCRGEADVELPSVRYEWWPTRFVVAMRHVGPTDELFEAWARLYMWASERELWSDDVTCFGFHYDDWRKGERPSYRYDAAIEVSPSRLEALGAANDVLWNISWPDDGDVERDVDGVMPRSPRGSTTRAGAADASLLAIPGGCVALADFEGSMAEYDRRWWWLTHQWAPGAGYRVRTEFVLDRYPSEFMNTASADGMIQATSCLPVERSR